MVTPPHETLHRIFQEHPPMLAKSLKVFGVSFPHPKEVSVLSVDLTEIRPLERRADTAMLVTTAIGKHVFVVESQTDPKEAAKQSWPYYVAFLNNKYKCPVTLLVTTSDLRTARWARQPIKMGLEEAPTQITRPLVLGPDNVPMITTVEEAQADVTLAVFSALTHRHSRGVKAILEALDAALDREDRLFAGSLAEFTETGLEGSPAVKIWRAMMGTMTHEYQSELRRKGRAEGLQQGLQEGLQAGRLREAVAAVLRVLEVRGLEVPEHVARRVKECTDLTVVEDLHARAVVVDRAEDLFTDPVA